MPGYRKRNQGPCQQRQRRGMRLILRPSLLLLLAEKESHGYELFDKLGEFGFDPDCLDSSIIYRDLREMESQGLITSNWDDDSKGPRRRVYQINEDGEQTLQDWVIRLENHQDRIEIIKERFQSL
jgi:poly-beta-hydroxybutyrate-responsive repressor